MDQLWDSRRAGQRSLKMQIPGHCPQRCALGSSAGKAGHGHQQQAPWPAPVQVGRGPCLRNTSVTVWDRHSSLLPAVPSLPFRRAFLAPPEARGHPQMHPRPAACICLAGLACRQPRPSHPPWPLSCPLTASCAPVASCPPQAAQVIVQKHPLPVQWASVA